MGKHIFEEGPRKGHAAGDTSVEQQASQLASDIKYKAREKMKAKAGSDRSPAQVQALYRQLFNASPAPGPVKAIAKKKLFGEQVDPGIVPVSEHVKDSVSNVFTKVFLGEEEARTVRVTDRATRNTRYVKADRAKVAELRKNTNIASVEYTGHKADPTDAEKASGGKKAKKDYDGDGKVESGSKEHAGAVHNAIQRKKGGVADGKDTRKEEYVDEALTGERAKKALKKPGGTAYTRKVSADPAKRATRGGRGGESDFGAGDRGAGNKAARRAGTYQEEVIYETDENGGKQKKFDVMKGKNKVVINPKLGEQAEATTKPSAEDKKQIEMKKRILQKKMMLQKQTMQLQKQGKLPLNYSEENSSIRYCPKCDKDETRDECKYGGEYWDENSKPAKAEDTRSIHAVTNLTKNKLRAMGLKMSYDMEGESIDEVTYPSDFKKGSAVATSRKGRPQQHDQKTDKYGRRTTVDEQVPYGAKADKAVEKVRDQLAKYSDEKLKKIRSQNKKPAPIGVKESAEDRLRDQRMERGGVDGNKRYDRPPARKATNKELGIQDFTPAEKEKRAKEIAAHLKKMRR